MLSKLADPREAEGLSPPLRTSPSRTPSLTGALTALPRDLAGSLLSLEGPLLEEGPSLVFLAARSADLAESPLSLALSLLPPPPPRPDEALPSVLFDLISSSGSTATLAAAEAELLGGAAKATEGEPSTGRPGRPSTTHRLKRATADFALWGTPRATDTSEEGTRGPHSSEGDVFAPADRLSSLPVPCPARGCPCPHPP